MVHGGKQELWLMATYFQMNSVEGSLFLHLSLLSLCLCVCVCVYICMYVHVYVFVNILYVHVYIDIYAIYLSPQMILILFSFLPQDH